MQNFVPKEGREDFTSDRFIRSSRKIGIKNGIKQDQEQRIQLYKRMIASDEYVDFAIQRIAIDLTHFLLK